MTDPAPRSPSFGAPFGPPMGEASGRIPSSEPEPKPRTAALSLPRTAVIALGSVVMGDDGAGAAALAELEAGWELPEAVDRIDLGTPGPYFAEYVRGYEALIVMDALRTPGSPGQVKRFDEKQLKATPAGPRLTPHVLDLGEALSTLDFEGCKPARVVAIGVVPEVVRAGTELSPAIRAALPEMAALVAHELTALGFHAPRRERPEAAVVWWAADDAG